MISIIVNHSIKIPNTRSFSPPILKRALLLALAVCFFSGIGIAGPEITLSDDQKTLTVENAPEMEVIAIGKSVIVKKHAKGVFSFGGDVVIEGRVDGDVATIGGSVIQKENSYIGGDVIVFGGSYKPEGDGALREAGKETIVFGVWEDELRSLAQNPAKILTPEITWSFLAQRALLTLFWFAISLVLTTIAPGAVGRSVARIQLSTLKIAALGSIAFITTIVVIVGSVSVLPDFLSITLGVMGLLILLLGYVFGRVTLQVTTGKLIRKHFLSESNASETLTTLLGVTIWTMLLSVPYIWILALFGVFAMGVGLILTARNSTIWQKTQV